MRGGRWLGVICAGLFLFACEGTSDGMGVTPDAGGPAPLCTSDEDCDDGLFCNGSERCDTEGTRARCLNSEPPCVTGQSCSESDERCLTECDLSADADGDGVDAPECGGTDCDDSDPLRYPGATEVCDPVHRDEDCDPTTFGVDDDGDGFIDSECCNLQDSGELECGRDCNDQRSDINPTATEVCSGVDEDCDSNVDEDPIVPFFPDADGDLRGDDTADAVLACIPPVGHVSNQADCNDSDPAIHGGRVETCDMIDNDCDDIVDEGLINCCGNGVIDGLEECEDGNIAEGDGCDRNCQIEPGWDCPGPTCGTSCGDGIVVGTELCDDGNRFDGDLCSATCDRIGKVYVGDFGGCTIGTSGALSCWGQIANPPRGVFVDVIPARDAACAIREDGTVVCWDLNGRTREPDGRYIDIAGDSSNACGIREDGSIHCFAGDNTMDPIPSGSFSSLDTGSHVTCAIADDSSMSCFFDDFAAGALDDYLEPPPAGSYQQVSYPGTVGCALQTDGQLACFGEPNFPFLRDGVPSGAFLEVDCSGLHCCALHETGRPVCWGFNNDGQLDAPEGNFLDIDVGGTLSCGIRDDGSLGCWGDGAMPTPAKFDQIRVGDSVACALRTTGQAECWGQYGNHAPPDPLTTVVAGNRIACGIRATDGALICWDQSGNTDPLPGSGGVEYSSLNASSNTDIVCAVSVDGALQCWDIRQLVFGAASEPVEMAFESMGVFAEVGVGGVLVCARLQSGDGICWDPSRDSEGTTLVNRRVVSPPSLSQLQGSRGNAVCGLNASNRPECYGMVSGACPIAISTEMAQLSEGGTQNFCGVTATGNAMCWGCNWPGPVPSGTFRRVSNNGSTACGIRDDGSIECWGQQSWNLSSWPEL